MIEKFNIESHKMAEGIEAQAVKIDTIVIRDMESVNVRYSIITDNGEWKRDVVFPISDLSDFINSKDRKAYLSAVIEARLGFKVVSEPLPNPTRD